MMLDRIYLDAPSLVYRAFFALPQSITDERGRPVNAVRGFMDMVARVITDRRPREVVAVFDADWRPAWRVAHYAGYKSKRPEDPPELPPQFDVVTAVLDAAGIARAEARDFEADDVIATLVTVKPARERAAIVTGDRDLIALVRDPDIKLLSATRGFGKLEELDEAAVRDKYGIAPNMYTDYATLRGDPSDDLPGVGGIGPVRAAKLLEEHGSIVGILGHLDELPRKQAEAFEATRDYLAAMHQVVPLVRDVEVEMTVSGKPDLARMERLAQEHNLGGSARRLLRALTPES